MSRQLRPSAHCLNCGTAVATRFCAECGQENTSYRVSLGRLVGDLVEEVFQLESRLWRSLWALFRRPGLLSVEYNAGRRVRYTTPLRLYITGSFCYFFVAAVLPPAPRMGETRQVKVELTGDKVDLDHLPPPKNWVDKRIRERLGMIQKFDPKEVSTRARKLLVENTPKVMAVLVPLFALLLMLFFRGRFYVEHLVLALHLHAFFFFFGTLMELTRVNALENLALVAALVWGYVALHRVYGQSWLRTAWKTAIIGVVYSVLVGVGVVTALVGGFFLG